jgi:hypothetical protein
VRQLTVYIVDVNTLRPVSKAKCSCLLACDVHLATILCSFPVSAVHEYGAKSAPVLRNSVLRTQHFLAKFLPSTRIIYEMNISTAHHSGGAGIIEAKFEQVTVESFSKTTPQVKLGALWWAVHLKVHTFSYEDRHITCSLVNMNTKAVVVDFVVSAVSIGSLIIGDIGSQKKQRIAGHCASSLTCSRCLRITGPVSVAVRIVISAVESEYIGYERTLAPFAEDQSVDVAEISPPDVTICTANDTDEDACGIPAHKSILCFHSPVFKTMFKTGMKEASTNKITITDYPEPVVREFVRFLYADRTSRSMLHEYGIQLLEMADKYQVTSLLAVCEHYLCGHVDADNVLGLLTLADRCSALILKSTALAFIRSNLSAVNASGKTTDLSAELVKDLLKELELR